MGLTGKSTEITIDESVANLLGCRVQHGSALVNGSLAHTRSTATGKAADTSRIRSDIRRHIDEDVVMFPSVFLRQERCSVRSFD